jgi:hypothetical protein
MRCNSRRIKLERLRSCLAAAHNDFAGIEVHITPCDLTGFTFSATGECQPAHKIGTILRTPCPRVLYHIDKVQELVTARKRELLRSHSHALVFLPGCYK